MYIYVLCAHKYKKYNIAMYIYMWKISTCWCWGIPSLLVSVPFNRCFESHLPPWHIRFHEVNFCTSESEKRNFGLQRSNILGNSTGFGDSFFYIYIYIYKYIHIYMIMYIYIYAQGRVKSGWYWSVHTPETFLWGHTYTYTPSCFQYNG